MFKFKFGKFYHYYSHLEKMILRWFMIDLVLCKQMLLLLLVQALILIPKEQNVYPVALI